MGQDFQDVAYAAADGVARITVRRPGRLNAYRNETGDELQAALARAEADAAVRVAVLTGEGRAFGAGYDLTTVDPAAEPALDGVLERHFNPLVMQMRRSRLPIVTAVNGPCAGAAVGVALAGDIVLAAAGAYFYEPFVGIALVPDAGNTLFLTQMVGRVRATGMMLLGERLPVEEAREWGLVWKVVAADALGAEVDRVAGVLAGLAPGAVAATKRLIGAACEAGLEGQLGMERDEQGVAGRSPAMKAAVAGFFAGRNAPKTAI